MTTTRSGVTQPDQWGVAGSHDRRLDVIERGGSVTVEQPKILDEKVFYADVVAVKTSGVDHLRRPLLLTAVIILLGTSGTSTTTVHVLKNGTALTPTGGGSPDMVLGSGIQAVRYAFAAPYSGSEDPTRADLIAFSITGAGTGAAQMTMKALFG